MTSSPLQFLFSTLLQTPSRWYLHRIDSETLFILKSKSPCTEAYLALAPTTRGRASEFCGFCLCYCSAKTGEMLAVDVNKDDLRQAVEELTEYQEVKELDNEEERTKQFLAWFEGLSVTTCTIEVRVVETDLFHPIPAFQAPVPIEPITTTPQPPTVAAFKPPAIKKRKLTAALALSDLFDIGTTPPPQKRISKAPSSLTADYVTK